MVLTYCVRADVVDIRNDSPKPSDAFLVDTNVWYWMTYTRASQGRRPPTSSQAGEYPSYLNKALSVKASLRICLLTLPELANLIERTELDVHSRTFGLDKSKLKEFRHNYSKERKQVVTEIRTAWAQIKSLATPIDMMVNEPFADAALGMCGTYPVNGYDLFILEALKRSGLGTLQIITDDGDFVTVPGIVVFTSNRTAIQDAQAQGKLIGR